ncbi:hypothetical protein D3C81_830520 [compost metagenome]
MFGLKTLPQQLLNRASKVPMYRCWVSLVIFPSLLLQEPRLLKYHCWKFPSEVGRFQFILPMMLLDVDPISGRLFLDLIGPLEREEPYSDGQKAFSTRVITRYLGGEFIVILKVEPWRIQNPIGIRQISFVVEILIRLQMSSFLILMALLEVFISTMKIIGLLIVKMIQILRLR